ncbi:MAG TPA: hypothetical protein VF705_15170, partial [Longimicrobium sp.]
DWKMGGIYRAPRELRSMAEQLLQSCCEYGLFIVPTGELECWLPELEVGGHGPEWLTAVFQKMGTDPGSREFLHPAEGGVWRFMQSVAKWIADPRRKGMRNEVIPLDHLLAPPDEDSIAKVPETNGDRRREGNPEGGRRASVSEPSDDGQTNGKQRDRKPVRRDRDEPREHDEIREVTPANADPAAAPLQAHAADPPAMVEPRAA